MSSESAIQASLIRCARKHKPKVFVLNIHGDAYQVGFPDLVFCYKGFFITLEVKNAQGKLRAGQINRIREVRAAGGIAEPCRTQEKLQRILDMIDRGEPWQPTPLEDLAFTKQRTRPTCSL